MRRGDAGAVERLRETPATPLSAVALVARAAVRGRVATIAVVLAVAALVSCATLTAAAGARRTATVVDRMIAEFPTPDHTVGIYLTTSAGDPVRLRAAEEALTGLPGVDRAVAMPGFTVLGPDSGSGVLEIRTALDGRFLDSGWTGPLRDGRLPAVDAQGEVVFDAGTASRLGLEIGDEFVAPTVSAETADAVMRGLSVDVVADGPQLTFTVVGIFRESVVDDPDFGYGLASPDTAQYLGQVGVTSALFAIGGDSDVDILATREAVATALGTSLTSSYDADTDIELDPVRDTVDITATGLALFALLAAAAGMIALGQVVGREVADATRPATVTRSLGMRDRETAVAVALPSAVAASAGIIAGAIGAAALSPIFPTGQGRLAEPDLGVRIDWLVLVVGALVMMAIMSAWAFVAAHRRVGARNATSHQRVRGGPSSLWSALPVSAAIGSGSVLVPNRIRAGVRPASALLGSVLGVAGVLAISVFIVSQQATADDPTRYGVHHDVDVDVAVDDPEPLFTALAVEPAIAAVGVLTCGGSRVGTDDALLCGWEVLSGSMPMTYLDGRAPSSPAEVVAGTTTAADLGVEVGDLVEVTGETRATRSLEVVGLVVIDDLSGPDSGLITTPETAQALIGVDTRPTVLLTYSPDLPPEDVEQVLADDYGLTPEALGYAAPPLLVERLGLVRPTLVALAVLLGTLGAIGLVHFLLLLTARRRREAAVLRALGFVRLQTIAVVVWQAVTIAMIGLLIGAPLGLVLGRSTWVASVDQLGIVDDPTVPWRFTAVLLIAVLLGAGLLGLLVGWRAVNTKTVGLHDE